MSKRGSITENHIKRGTDINIRRLAKYMGIEHLEREVSLLIKEMNDKKLIDPVEEKKEFQYFRGKVD